MWLPVPRRQPVFIPLCGIRKAMVIPAKERHPEPSA